MKLIDKLRSNGLKVNDNNINYIHLELDKLGYFKMKELLLHKNDIDSMIELYKWDCRMSIFLWKHIRRIESELKAILINYFKLNGNEFICKDSKILKPFLLKYMVYTEVESKLNVKTYTAIDRLIKKYNPNIAKICNFIRESTLGSLIDFVDILDLNKNLEIKDKLTPLMEIRYLHKVRNKIAHHEILVSEFTKDNFQNFWSIIKGMSPIDQNHEKSEKDFIDLINSHIIHL